MKKTFLYRVWQHDRRLCYLLILFGIATLFFNVLGTQVTPFFVWGMYSEKEQPVAQYELLRTTVNDSMVIDASAGYAPGTRFFLGTPLSYYLRMKQNGGIDPTISFLRSKARAAYQYLQPWEARLFNGQVQLQQFPDWYVHYLQEITGQSIYNVQVDVLQVHYDNSQRIILDSSYQLLQWPGH
ncbi:hypothetical protein [Paraflavitalea pollutisoli]|uniref:hypothetical protein n=1 Tax=Paraflavitalea pollutisoli TaxID=3034143 RepID=UPI0023EAD539|nr:hypothetical protein [Paraflavitalea sp. H1-2-19X]